MTPEAPDLVQHSWPAWFWVGWLFAFLVVEIYEATGGRHGTFSETTWDWFGVKNPRFREHFVTVRRVILGAFGGYLFFGHLLFTTSVTPVIMLGLLVSACIVIDMTGKLHTPKP